MTKKQPDINPIHDMREIINYCWEHAQFIPPDLFFSWMGKLAKRPEDAICIRKMPSKYVINLVNEKGG